MQDLTKVERNDMVVRWMCNMTLKDRKSSNMLNIRNFIRRGQTSGLDMLNGQR